MHAQVEGEPKGLKTALLDLFFCVCVFTLLSMKVYIKYYFVLIPGVHHGG